MHQESPVSLCLWSHNILPLMGISERARIELAQKAEQVIARLKLGLMGGAIWPCLYGFSEVY